MVRLATDLGIEGNEIYPADYFDLMGGVGFGGHVHHPSKYSDLSCIFSLVTFMLGHLRMSVDEAIEALLEVVSAVFPMESQETLSPEINSKNLRGAIESMLHARDMPLTAKMNDPGRPRTGCKVCVFSLPHVPISQPH